MNRNTVWFPAGLLVILILICQRIQAIYATSSDKTVYVVHYKEGRNIIPVTVEIDYEQKTEYVLNLSPKSRRKSITFYDFSEDAVAYKYLNSDLCFISHFSEETLETSDKTLKKLQNKVIIKESSSLVTLWASNRTLSPKLVRRLAGERIREFCKSAASFFVTSSEYESFKSRSKRDITAEKQQKGQFTHRSYGHYGHQSHNYAHYGHETYSGGQLSSAGEAAQKIEQQQIRRDGPQVTSPTGISHPLLPPGSSEHVGGLGTRGSEGFVLRAGYQGGYQINQPLGLQAGSQYRGALSTQVSDRLPAGVSTSILRTPGPLVRDIPAIIPAVSTESRYRPSGTALPGYPPSGTARHDYVTSGVTQPGYPSSGAAQPIHRPLETARSRLDYPPPGISQTVPPSNGVKRPGYQYPVVAYPGYPSPEIPPCCRPAVQPLGTITTSIPSAGGAQMQPSGITQPSYPPSGVSQLGHRPAEIHSGYLPSGISDTAHPSNGVKRHDSQYPTVAGPSHPSLGLPPCCKPKVQLPGILDASIPSPGAAKMLPSGAAHPSFPPSGIAQPGYQPSGIAQHIYRPSEIAQSGHRRTEIAHTRPGYQPSGITHFQTMYPSNGAKHPDYTSPVETRPGYPLPEMPLCCQPKVHPPGTVVPHLGIPSEITQPGYLPPGVTHPDGRLPTAVTPDLRQPDYPKLSLPQPAYPHSGVPQPGYPYPGVPRPGYPSPDVSKPGYPSRAVSQPGYPHPGVPQPGYPSPGVSQPGYPSPGVSEPGFPSPGVLQAGYPAPGDLQPSYPSAGALQPSYLVPGVQPPPGYSSFGVPQPDYPSPVLPQPSYQSPGVSQPLYPSPGAPQPGYPHPGVPQPGYLVPGVQPPPGYPSPGVLHPIYPSPGVSHPIYPSPGVSHPIYTSPGVSHPIYPSPGAPQPGYPYPSAPQHAYTSPGIPQPGYPSPVVPQPGYLPPAIKEPSYPTPGMRTDGLVSVLSKKDTAVSQTQVQTGYEGTAAEATSLGRHGGLGAQTQVQGGYTGNGSFSAQAQSGFTGGVLQSQVRGGKQGGSSGSSAQVEKVGSTQSQVQVGRPSGAATGSAQGKFFSGVTQVQAQSGKSGGSAGAQAQSRGTSSSQVQVNVAEGESQVEDGFQGGVSASVSGGYFGGQAQTQLQGGYDSGRTYVATAQGGFDSTSEFTGSVPGVGSIPGMIVRPLNGRQRPSNGVADSQYLLPPATIGVSDSPRDQISRPFGYEQLRPLGSDSLYPKEYHFPNGSTKLSGSDVRDEVGISRTTAESRRPSRFPGDSMTISPGTSDIIPSLNHSKRLPQGPLHSVQLTGMHEPSVFSSAHPGHISSPRSNGAVQHVPGVPSPLSQRSDSETRGIPDMGLQPSHFPPDSRAVQPRDFMGIPASTGEVKPHDSSSQYLPGFPRALPAVPSQPTPNGYTPGRVVTHSSHDQRFLDRLPYDRTTQTHRTLPPQSEQLPHEQTEIRPSRDMIHPDRLTPTHQFIPGITQPVDRRSFPRETRNVSREMRPPVQQEITPHAALPTSSGPTVPDCCKSKKDWRTRCCHSRKSQQNGSDDITPRCCASKYPDDDSGLNGDFDSDESVQGKDSCRIVKAVCYLVYKPNGRARVCKPTGTRGC